MRAKIESVLNLLPEVTWDRWIGDLNDYLGIGVFGWIPRAHGKSDFCFLRIDKSGAWMVVTSSAKYSAEFSTRLGFDTKGRGHGDCKRVEDYFNVIKAVGA